MWLVLGTGMATIICGDGWGWEWLLRRWGWKLQGRGGDGDNVENSSGDGMGMTCAGTVGDGDKYLSPRSSLASTLCGPVHSCSNVDSPGCKSIVQMLLCGHLMTAASLQPDEDSFLKRCYFGRNCHLDSPKISLEWKFWDMNMTFKPERQKFKCL